MKAKERNSSLEILRLICMLGIVIMHTSGPMINYASGFNVLWIQIENGLFQAGVSIFVIISGYFGIKTTFERVLKLELKVWGYSIISGTIIYFLIDNSFLRLIKSVFPIITNKYWFLTGYMLLMLFAPFINSAIEKMEKEQYKKLLMMMLLLFFSYQLYFILIYWVPMGKIYLICCLCIYLEDI